MPLVLLSYDMYQDIEEKLAKRDGKPYTGNFVEGLPTGLELSNGVIVGKD